MTPPKVLSDIDRISVETGYSTSTLNRILFCESGNSSTTPPNTNSNGSVDYGRARINSIHLPEAKKLGLDVINNDNDNITYFGILVKRNGLSDYSASKHCWKGY